MFVGDRSRPGASFDEEYLDVFASFLHLIIISGLYRKQFRVAPILCEQVLCTFFLSIGSDLSDLLGRRRNRYQAVGLYPSR